MQKNKPLILITNDDGYQATGIQSLTESVLGLGEVVVFAPDGPRSGMSSAITSVTPIRYRLLERNEEKDLTIYACTGTPVDCIKLAICEVLTRKPDIVISGINHGTNASICVMYSGTMGAAIEGCIWGIPSVGFSLTDHSANADFSESKKIARLITQRVMSEGLPKGVCLNVNIPDVERVKGLRVCRQTKGQWIKEFRRSTDGAGREIFWLTGEFRNDEPNATDSDEWALAQGFASIVPTRIDMTDYQLLAQIGSWEQTL